MAFLIFIECTCKKRRSTHLLRKNRVSSVLRPLSSCPVLCLPLQAASGSGSRWTRPSRCCRATNPSTPSIFGGSSSAAPRPTATPSCRASRPTTTTPTTAPRPPRPRRAACWAPPADRTAPGKRPVRLWPGRWESVQFLHESKDFSEPRLSCVYNF